jgi:hypothetical protein
MAEEQTQEKKIILDEKEVTLQQLEEAQKNQATRIVETESGKYKTLQHLKD